MGQKVYARPSGTTIIVTDTPETRQYAEENGWVEHTPKRPRRKAKAKPKSKE
jgi:hypothetical protein